MEDVGGGATGRICELFDKAVFFRPDLVSLPRVMEISRHLEQVWMSEERVLYAPFLHQLGESQRPRLVSGFFAPESHNNLIRRWTAGQFCFVIPTWSVQPIGRGVFQRRIRTATDFRGGAGGARVLG